MQLFTFLEQLFTREEKEKQRQEGDVIFLTPTLHCLQTLHNLLTQSQHDVSSMLLCKPVSYFNRVIANLQSTIKRYIAVFETRSPQSNIVGASLRDGVDLVLRETEVLLVALLSSNVLLSLLIMRKMCLNNEAFISGTIASFAFGIPFQTLFRRSGTATINNTSDDDEESVAMETIRTHWCEVVSAISELVSVVRSDKKSVAAATTGSSGQVLVEALRSNPEISKMIASRDGASSSQNWRRSLQQPVTEALDDMLQVLSSDAIMA